MNVPKPQLVPKVKYRNVPEGLFKEIESWSRCSPKSTVCSCPVLVQGNIRVHQEELELLRTAGSGSSSCGSCKHCRLAVWHEWNNTQQMFPELLICPFWGKKKDKNFPVSFNNKIIAGLWKPLNSNTAWEEEQNLKVNMFRKRQAIYPDVGPISLEREAWQVRRQLSLLILLFVSAKSTRRYFRWNCYNQHHVQSGRDVAQLGTSPFPPLLTWGNSMVFSKRVKPAPVRVQLESLRLKVKDFSQLSRCSYLQPLCAHTGVHNTALQELTGPENRGETTEEAKQNIMKRWMKLISYEINTYHSFKTCTNKVCWG